MKWFGVMMGAEVVVNMAFRVTLAILGIAIAIGVFVRRIALSSRFTSLRGPQWMKKWHLWLIGELPSSKQPRISK
jgi:hypothetical protein